jgi:hypothetical protein
VHHVRGKKAGTSETIRIPLGKGVHSAYDDKMVNAHRKAILARLDKAPKVRESHYERPGGGSGDRRAYAQYVHTPAT